MMQKTYRQGDILLKKVTELPVGAEKVDGLVLAEGEITGHKHRLVGETVQIFRVGDKRFVRARTVTELVHEEHKPIRVKKGLYEVVVQEEYTPAGARQVQD